MRASIAALIAAVSLASSSAEAHGPQIQITRDNGQITTRRLLREEPYWNALRAPTSAYVIPLLETSGVWYARPNNTPNPTIPGVPLYISGPGIAFGFDQADGGPRTFAGGFRFELKLIDGLQTWDGSAFVDPGAEEIEAFRSSSIVAATNDSLTPASPATMPYGNVSASYNQTAHSGASFRLLGDGVSPPDDGVYLLSMQYASNEPGLSASDPFYFVLHKNAPIDDILAAVNSLGLASSTVQFVPEPGTAALVVTSAGCIMLSRRRRILPRRTRP